MAEAPKSNTPATTETKSAKTRKVAQFVGHAGTKRIITKKDQDSLTGVKGSAEKDLVWEPGNHTKVDITDVQPDVIEYIENDPDFKVKAVELPS